MFIRRIFFSWQFIASFALPLWLFVGWGFFGEGGATGVLAILVGAPILLLGMLAVSALTFFRGTVRDERAVSWRDIAILLPWQAAIFALGFHPAASASLVVLVLILGLVAFWNAVWQLLADTKRRLAGALDGLEHEARRRSAPPVGFDTPRNPGFDAHSENVIIIEEKRPRA
ncbi:MFS transporter [Homoserinimonas sp. OAct 916]|uniref:MFS transporter n=1 Tax=Homoserinimonas sp. OAct 916 TaxID=2211450 RepID=UPI000DBE64E6|nr:MFS transporter [Homoserinimonas sp. OAct 916]